MPEIGYNRHMSDPTGIIEFRNAFGGRPKFKFTPEIEDFILSGVVSGLSLRIIYDEGKAHFGGEGKFPSPALMKIYVASNAEFQARYARAKDISQDIMAEDLIDIIDGTHPQFAEADLAQRKASVEERKWIMGKLRRKKWGEVKVTEVTGADGQSLIPSQTIDPRTLPAEAKAALYDALQMAIAQTNATDAKVTEEEEDK